MCEEDLNPGVINNVTQRTCEHLRCLVCLVSTCVKEIVPIALLLPVLVTV